MDAQDIQILKDIERALNGVAVSGYETRALLNNCQELLTKLVMRYQQRSSEEARAEAETDEEPAEKSAGRGRPKKTI